MFWEGLPAAARGNALGRSRLRLTMLSSPIYLAGFQRSRGSAPGPDVCVQWGGLGGTVAPTVLEGRDIVVLVYPKRGTHCWHRCQQ